VRIEAAKRLLPRRCAGHYQELSKKGVRFKGPPEERPYGIETLMQDESGNWFSVVQRPR
jgi:hypothetical protein